LRERAAAALVARDEPVELGEVEHAEELGAVENGFERTVAQPGGSEIEHRPCGRGDRQAPEHRDLVLGEYVRAVDPDAGPALSARPPAYGEVDQARAGRAEPVRVRGAVVAEEGVVAECEHRRPPPTFATDGGMSDGVHATVQLMQPSRIHAATDLPARQAEADQLIERDDAGLTHREPRDQPIRGELSTHVVLKPRSTV
jgi:hypothetical protein